MIRLSPVEAKDLGKSVEGHGGTCFAVGLEFRGGSRLWVSWKQGDLDFLPVVEDSEVASVDVVEGYPISPSPFHPPKGIPHWGSSLRP